MIDEDFKGLHDSRTRVTLFLPLVNPRHEKAIYDIIDYLKSKRDDPVPVTGFIRSNIRNLAYAGYWWSDENSCWVDESNISFVIDFGLDFDSIKLPSTLEELKRTISDKYEQYGSRQEEIWVIAYSVKRYV